MAEPLHLDGRQLTIAALARAAAAPRARLTLCPQALARMAASREILMQAIREGRPVYGVTTGLGAKSGEALGKAEIDAFAAETIRGRAHAVGPPEPAAAVRAAMIVRLNTLLSGHSGASPALAQHLHACLGAGLIPLVPMFGSVGTADLTWNATLALGLLGEAPLAGPDGETAPGDEMLRRHGIAPWVPGPRDGLAIVSHSCGVVARGALALAEAGRACEAAHTAAALTMLAMQANLSPFGAEVLALGGHAAQEAAAAAIRARLAGSGLGAGQPPRRLQDPLSMRNIPQVHGTVLAALGFATATLEVDLNGCSDNPVVLVAQGEVHSCGAYLTAHLTHALEGVSRAFVHLATAQVARMARLLSPEFSGLPLFLAAPGAAANGFAPVLKTVEALLAELMHEAQPVALWPSVNAHGVEDVLTSAPVAARALGRIAALALRLSAAEMMMAAQAIDLRGAGAQTGPALGAALALVRRASPPLVQARPLGGEIEALAGLLCA